MDSNIKTRSSKRSYRRCYQCHYCGRSFKYPTSFRIHIRTHTGERPYKCTVDNCTRTFGSRSSLNIHTRIHLGEKPNKCDVCGKAFSNTSSLKIHQRVHTNENPYVCHLCGKLTKQANNLIPHYKMLHNVNVSSQQIRKNARILAEHFTGEEIDKAIKQQPIGVNDLLIIAEDRIRINEQLKLEEEKLRGNQEPCDDVIRKAPKRAKKYRKRKSVNISKTEPKYSVKKSKEEFEYPISRGDDYPCNITTSSTTVDKSTENQKTKSPDCNTSSLKNLELLMHYGKMMEPLNQDAILELNIRILLLIQEARTHSRNY